MITPKENQQIAKRKIKYYQSINDINKIKKYVVMWKRFNSSERSAMKKIKSGQDRS